MKSFNYIPNQCWFCQANLYRALNTDNHYNDISCLCGKYMLYSWRYDREAVEVRLIINDNIIALYVKNNVVLGILTMINQNVIPLSINDLDFSSPQSLEISLNKIKILMAFS